MGRGRDVYHNPQKSLTLAINPSQCYRQSASHKLKFRILIILYPCRKRSRRRATRGTRRGVLLRNIPLHKANETTRCLHTIKQRRLNEAHEELSTSSSEGAHRGKRAVGSILMWPTPTCIAIEAWYSSTNQDTKYFLNPPSSCMIRAEKRMFGVAFSSLLRLPTVLTVPTRTDKGVSY
jgi:hypothetical protein